jgi:hypothetical protein
MSENRRQHHRISGPFDGKRLGPIETQVQIYDLSEGGCFVNSMQEQQVGREVELEIHLPSQGAIRVVGLTVYSRPDFGFAARFTKIDADSMAKLLREVGRRREGVDCAE